MFLLVLIAFVFSQVRAQDDIDHNPHVFHGEDAPEGKWPFMASMQNVKYIGGHGCGAAVINDDTALTAAHCIHNNSGEGEFIYLGQVKLKPYDNNSMYMVDKFITHPNYDPKANKPDIGLIKLKRRIGKTCLPNSDSIPDESKCIAIGWGYTDKHDGIPNRLQQAKIPIISPTTKCYKDVDEKMLICAGYLKGGPDTCNGDSGGPLVCPLKSDPAQWFQYGTSFGVECGKGPGAYVRVSSYIDWIKKVAES